MYYLLYRSIGQALHSCLDNDDLVTGAHVPISSVHATYTDVIRDK
jgi:hypothetical protein